MIPEKSELSCYFGCMMTGIICCLIFKSPPGITCAAPGILLWVTGISRKIKADLTLLMFNIEPANIFADGLLITNKIYILYRIHSTKYSADRSRHLTKINIILN
jgi:hypothetical protein